ncbi:MAG: DUF3341 domain-containing protein [Polyangiaceae bacterium]|nr:DUF3341 domain-containing protein [Polyangiaceae bacterium]
MSARVFVGWFDDEHALLRATTAAREDGLAIVDVFTPFAVHGIDEAMGLRRSRLPIICFCAGATGLAFGIFLQVYASAVSWPLNVGGKPFNSMPAFLPVIFELTVLCAALITVAALLIRTRLFPRIRAPKNLLARVTDDRFALVLSPASDTWNEKKAVAICDREGALSTTYEEVES